MFALLLTFCFKVEILNNNLVKVIILTIDIYSRATRGDSPSILVKFAFFLESHSFETLIHFFLSPHSFETPMTFQFLSNNDYKLVNKIK